MGSIFELRYRDGSQFLPFGIRMGGNLVKIFKLRYNYRHLRLLQP